MVENTEQSTVYWKLSNLRTEWVSTLCEAKEGCKLFNCIIQPK